MERVLDAAAAEKAYAAEKSVGYVRTAIVVTNTLVYLLLMDKAGTRPALAGAIIVVALAYSFWVNTFQPYRRFPVLLSSYVTSVTDAFLITVWIFATGGFESPFYVLWYASLAAISYRYDFRASIAAGFLYSIAYFALVASLGQVAGNAADLVVRIAYIVAIAVLGAFLARDSLGLVASKLEMRERMDAARTGEAKFRSLLEGAPDAILLVDREGRIALVNSQTERTFGYARDELLGLPIASILAESPEQDVVGRRRDGREFPAEVSRSPLDGQGGLTVTSVRDVTERRRSDEVRRKNEEQVRELERLKELDRFKTQFINTAAHELGTPLTPIKVQLHLLKMLADSDGLPEKGKKAIGVLDRNVDRLTFLLQDVLSAARLQANRLGVNKERMDLNVVVLEAVESFQDPARESGVALEARLMPDVAVQADAQRVTQVLFNLLSNALKFTPAGGRIVVETRRDEDGVVVSVADTGAGLAPDQIARLFQPFSQVHDTSQKTRAGTGLGLYISKGIVELHGGRMWCESRGPGRGTTFSFFVPFEEPAPPARVEVASAAETMLDAAEPSPAGESTHERLADGIARRVRDLV